MKALPLEGIRVLDLSRVLAGPLCSMMLGDLGAHVMKVERPGVGDDTRGWGPPFADDGDSGYFRSINRNKRSIALNLRDPKDQALVAELLQSADVVIDNFLPSVLASYGLDKDAELARNSRLIWCTISGFGPGSERPGYDFVVQAESGWMAIAGPEQGPPMKAGVAFADVITGKDAAVAILAAPDAALPPPPNFGGGPLGGTPAAPKPTPAPAVYAVAAAPAPPASARARAFRSSPSISLIACSHSFDSSTDSASIFTSNSPSADVTA